MAELADPPRNSQKFPKGHINLKPNEINMKNKNWNLAVDLNSLAKLASEVQWYLYAVEVNGDSDNWKIHFEAELAKLSFQMTVVQYNIDKLKNQ